MGSVIGPRVRARRLDLGLTLRVVEARARAAGAFFPDRYLAKIERNEVSGIRSDKLRALAIALQCSADYLLGLTYPSDART